MAGPLIIVAALVLDVHNRALLAERPFGKKFAGQWELPGGKIDPGETEEEALARELFEELNIVTEAATLTRSPVTIQFGAGGVEVRLYECRAWRGVPEGREGQKLAWVATEDFENYKIMSGIRDVLAELQKHYPTVVHA